MARRRRRSLRQMSRGSAEPAHQTSLEELWHRVCILGRQLSPHYNGYVTHPHEAHSFAPRIIRNGRHYLPHPDDQRAFLDAYERGILTRNILTERITIMASVAKSVEHFPSSPHRPPTISLRFDSIRGLAIHGFCTLTAAKSFLDLVIGANADLKWLSSTKAKLDDLTITSHNLEDIVEHERTIELPAPYPSLANQIMYAGDFSEEPEPTPTKRALPTRKSKKQSSDTPPARQKQLTGVTTIAQLASDIGIEPSKARAILRKNKVEKPADGWQWADPAPIAAMLKKG